METLTFLLDPSFGPDIFKESFSDRQLLKSIVERDDANPMTRFSAINIRQEMLNR